MSEIDHLKRNSPLHDVIETINSLVDSLDSYKDAMTDRLIGEIAKYESDSRHPVLQSLDIPTMGKYTVNYSGNLGTTVTIKVNHVNTGVVESHSATFQSYFYNTTGSIDLGILGAGDIVTVSISYADPLSGYTASVSIKLTDNLFTMVGDVGTRQQVVEMSNKVDDMEDDVEAVVSLVHDLDTKYNTLLDRSKLILDNYTEQISLLQKDIQSLSLRIP